MGVKKDDKEGSPPCIQKLKEIALEIGKRYPANNIKIIINVDIKKGECKIESITEYPKKNKTSGKMGFF